LCRLLGEQWAGFNPDTVKKCFLKAKGLLPDTMARKLRLTLEQSTANKITQQVTVNGKEIKFSTTTSSETRTSCEVTFTAEEEVGDDAA
jgi:hypothetical protein